MSIPQDDKIARNVLRAGELFMYCLWLQAQMVDLLILRKHPALVSPFVEIPATVPIEMAEIRMSYWEKDFRPIKNEFVDSFSEYLAATHLADLETVQVIRNAIAHCHVSLGRDYFLYRAKGAKREGEVMASLGIFPHQDNGFPFTVAFRFWDDSCYLTEFNRIKRLDEECFRALADRLGVPHSRIR